MKLLDSALSPVQRRFVLLTAAGFAFTLIGVALVVSRLAPPSPQPPPAVLAEPVSYEALDHDILANETRNLNTYRWQSDHAHAEVPLSRAIEILATHPEGISQ